MNVSQPQHNAWVGLAASSSQNTEAIRQLREVLPPESRIVSTADHPTPAHVIADVIRGGEPCVLGCSQGDAHHSLVVLVTSLRSLGSIRHVVVMESNPVAPESSPANPVVSPEAARTLISQLNQTQPVINAPLTLAVDSRTAPLLHAAGGSFPW
jgi:hypothetical protein